MVHMLATLKASLAESKFAHLTHIQPAFPGLEIRFIADSPAWFRVKIPSIPGSNLRTT
jgi:hypothetical protein